MQNSINKTRALIVLTFFCTTVGCIEEKDNNSTLNEAKWAMYYMNYEKIAKPYHTGTDLPKRLEVVQCDIQQRIVRTNGDTTLMFFRFYYKDTLSTYILSPPDGEYMCGVGLVNGKITFPINSVGIFDFMKYPDSVSMYMQRQEQGFIQYLRNYSNPSEMSDWLKLEMRSRVK